MNNTFSATNALSFGWNTFKKNRNFWLIAALLMMVTSSGGSFNIPFESSKTETTQIQTNEMYQNQNFDQQMQQLQQLQQMQMEQLEQQGYPVDMELQENMKMQMQESNTGTPFVPDKVDDVLGISDSRESGDIAKYIALIGIAGALLIPFYIAILLTSTAIQMGFVKLSLAAARGSKVSYEIIMSDINLKKAGRYLIASILLMLLIGVGLLLVIIPGIYFALKYFFVPYLIIDKNMKIGEAFKASSKMTTGHKFSLFVLGILAIIVNILGFVALIYGLLVSMPVTLLAYGYAYNKLSSGSKA